jgi:hypothetical protein
MNRWPPMPTDDAGKDPNSNTQEGLCGRCIKGFSIQSPQRIENSRPVRPGISRIKSFRLIHI